MKYVICFKLPVSYNVQSLHEWNVLFIQYLDERESIHLPMVLTQLSIFIYTGSENNHKIPMLWELVLVMVMSKTNKLFEAIEENQIETGNTDLAHQHDHYLYGINKRD